MSRYIHHVPGRLRIRCNSFRHNPLKLESIAGQMAQSCGVKDVTMNVSAGSITILYDINTTGHDELIGALNERGCAAHQVTGAVSGVSARFVKDTVTRTIVGTIIGSLVKSAVEPQVLGILRVARLAR